MARRRLDELLVARGLAPTRERAGALVLAGKVRVGGRPETKAGAQVAEGAELAVAAAKPYASRGGEKLAFALDGFGIEVEGRACLDAGAATGGFTSCLLSRGAAHVHALDVARGALAWNLRTDVRVTVWEGVNARDFDGGRLAPAPTLLVIDVSFIGLGKILRPLVPTLAQLEDIVALVKPQFEAPRRDVAPGGVVRDAAVHEEVITRVAEIFLEIGFPGQGVVASPLLGPAGNREFFLWGRKGAPARDLEPEIKAAVAADKTRN